MQFTVPILAIAAFISCAGQATAAGVAVGQFRVQHVYPDLSLQPLQRIAYTCTTATTKNGYALPYINASQKYGCFQVIAAGPVQPVFACATNATAVFAFRNDVLKSGYGYTCVPECGDFVADV